MKKQDQSSTSSRQQWLSRADNLTAQRRVIIPVVAGAALLLAVVVFFGLRQFADLRVELSQTQTDLVSQKDLINQKASLTEAGEACADVVSQKLQRMAQFNDALAVIGPQVENMWHRGARNVDWNAYIAAWNSVSDLTDAMSSLQDDASCEVK